MTEADKLDNKRLAGAFNVLIDELRKEELAFTRTLEERDQAEECLSKMFFVVTGRSPEWSNQFGYADALDEIEGVIAALKSPSALTADEHSSEGLAK